MIRALCDIFQKRDPYVILSSLMLVTLPFSIGLSNVTMGLMSAYWIFFDKKKEVKQTTILVLLLAPFLSYLIGTIYSENTSAAFFGLEKRLAFLAFPVIFSTISLSEEQKTSILTICLLSTIAAALACIFLEVKLHFKIYGNLFPLNYDFFKLSELSRGIKIDPPYFGIYIGFSIIIASQLYFNHSIGLISYIAIALFLGTFIVLLGARTAIFATMISLSIIWIIRKKKQGVLLIAGVLLLFFLGVMLNSTLRDRIKDGVTLKKADQADHLESYSSLSLRLAKWKCAVSIFYDNLLLGVGPGDRQAKLNGSYLLNGVDEAYIKQYNAHNQYLDTAVALGLFGLIPLLALFVLGISFSIRTNNLVYFCFLLLFIFCLITESMFERQKGIVFFSFFNSLFLNFSHNK